MIIGTAGHIDHGKSALVEALTGWRMDRLAEERRRGITIELNFAPFDLGEGRVVGVVDVPGHEDFVRTMVAGASGIDLVLLVIAADEGIMPQTREHLAIIEQLGVPTGIPVITKADLVEPELLELVTLEVGEWLRHSAVRFGSPVVVAAPEGRGLDALRARIRELVSTPSPGATSDLFRLPVDRVFSVAGVGTVVTGTVWSGSVVPGDPVRIMPSGREVRIRTIEIHGRKTDRSEPRARNALGLAGLDRDLVARGDWVVGARTPWAATTALDVELVMLDSERQALRSRSRLRVLLGTGELLARVYPREPLLPGRPCLARLALEAPAAVRGGDRFVVRSYSPVDTIGGGQVLDPSPPRRRADWPGGLRSQNVAERLVALVARRRSGVGTGELPVLLGCPPEEVPSILDTAPELRRIGDRVVHRSALMTLAPRAEAEVHRYHQSHPAQAGLPLETLRSSLRAPEWLVEALLADLRAAGVLEVEGALVRAPGFRPRVSGGDAEVDRVVSVVAEAGLTPPSLMELEERFGRRDVEGMLRIAAGEGRVVAVERDRYFAPQALDRFVTALRELGGAAAITPAGLRDRLGLSRKFLIPLLEWSDARGYTVRVGDARRLR